MPRPAPCRSSAQPRIARTAATGALAAIAILSSVVASAAADPGGAEQPAIAMHGAPLFPGEFGIPPYVNPDAPKGGRLVEGVLGTFDNLNPMIVQGLPVQTIRGYVVESLMAGSVYDAF